MLSSNNSRRNEELWFEDVRQQHLQATRDGRRAAGPDRLIKDSSVHNATVRLETAERMSETTSKITGSWAEAERHGTGQPPVRNTGQHSNRVFTVSLHKQQHFHEGCVKPHLRLDTAEGIVSEFDELKRPFYDRLVGERDWKYKPPVSPMAWKPETAKAKRPPSFLNSSMSPAERMKLIDWRCFGQRNHMSTPSVLAFHEQHGVPKDWNQTRLSMRDGTAPPLSKSVADFAAEKRSRSSMGFAESRKSNDLAMTVDTSAGGSIHRVESEVVERPMGSSRSSMGGAMASAAGGSRCGDGGHDTTTLPKHFYIGRKLQTRQTLEGSLRYRPVATPDGAEGARASRPPTAGFLQRGGYLK